MVYIAGRINMSEAKWITSKLTGMPLPAYDAPVTFGRMSPWAAPGASGQIAADGTMLIQVTEVAGNSEKWSAVYPRA